MHLQASLEPTPASPSICHSHCQNSTLSVSLNFSERPWTTGRNMTNSFQISIASVFIESTFFKVAYASSAKRVYSLKKYMCAKLCFSFFHGFLLSTPLLSLSADPTTFPAHHIFHFQNPHIPTK